MGLGNWSDNRIVGSSGRRTITVRASDPGTLDREVAKMERKGYVRLGNPYANSTGGLYSVSTFYQTMQYSEEAVEQINAQVEAYRQVQEEKKAKRKAALKKGWQMLKDFMGDEEENDK